MKEKICFIDADVFVNAFVNLHSKKHQASQVLLRQVEQDKIRLVTDYQVMSEVYHIIEKYKGTEFSVKMLKQLLNHDNLMIEPLGNSAFFEALKRANKFKLKINDLIHYTVALLNNAAGIYSYDKDFNGLEVERIEP